jgi:hypothetical protein
VENSSEKRGRGRPPAFPADAYRGAERGFPHIGTQRGRQNRLYAWLAMLELKTAASVIPDPALRAQVARALDWLTGGVDDPRRLRKTALLAELGRLVTTDKQKLVALACLVAEQRPTVPEGVRVVRRLRLDADSPPRFDGSRAERDEPTRPTADITEEDRFGTPGAAAVGRRAPGAPEEGGVP